MSVTIKDVARIAGVSPSTVSRVISGHTRISPQTTKKVKLIMEELGYHPNIMAKSLVSKTTRTLGILLPRPAEELFLNLFFAEIIRGILAQSMRASYDILLTSSFSEKDEVETVTRLVKGRRVDGIILLSSRKNDPLIQFLREQKFPFVLIGRSSDFPDITSVDNDNIQASFDATNHLIAQGHTRIRFVTGPGEMVVSEDRLEGYKRAMAAANIQIQPDWIIEGELLQQSGYRAMSFIMNQPERPTALVVFDDVAAFGVLRGLTEMGIKVPDDVKLVSFNNIALSELSSPPISSIDIGTYQLGYSASQTLIRIVQNEPLNAKEMIIPHRLIVRESSMNKVTHA